MLPKPLYFSPFPRCVFTFYAEIQDVHQKWKKKPQKLPHDSANTLGSKMSSKSLYLAPFVGENSFFHFTQKFKMATKMAGK